MGMKRNNPLSVTHPDIAEQWHPERNDGVTPDQIMAGSHQKVWWMCPKGPDHEWQTKPNDRTSNFHGCPFCANQKVSVTNALSTLFPDIGAQWHPEKNDGVTPDQVIAGSHKRYWWTCPKGPDHEWQATAGGRSGRGDGCPCCLGVSQIMQPDSAEPRFASDGPQSRLGPDGHHGLLLDGINIDGV